MGLDIRLYAGNGSDLADLITRTWTKTFGGKTWFPIWDRSYVTWRLMDPRILDSVLIVCAYENDTLVGCIVSEITDMRVRTSRVRASLASYLSVEPHIRFRGVAIRLLDALREAHRQRDVTICFGVTMDGPGSLSKRFWDGVQSRHADELVYLRSFRAWVAVCDSAGVCRAGLTWFDRIMPVAAGLIPWGWIGASGVSMRPYAPDDLTACRRLLEASTAKVEIAMQWSDDRLSLQLDHPNSRTWILEGPAGVEGLVNGYLIDWLGAAPVRVGFIEICVADGSPLKSAAMLVTAGRAFEREGAQMIVLMDAGCAPRAALCLAGFFPLEPHVRALALLNLGDLNVAGVATLHWAFT